MDHEILYQAIFHRKSVRKYDSTPLTPESLASLKDFIAQLTPLIPEIKTEVKLLPQNIVKTNAPQSLCLYSEKKDGYLMNAGFLMEQIDLYLSANNIGACWLGGRKPAKGSVQMPDGMMFVITLCIGTPAQEMHRANITEFKRESLNSISPVSDLYHILEPVRLAPSAVNKQPWYFGGTPERIVVSRTKSLLIDKLHQIDIGIALCCLWLSLKHQGKDASFDFTPSPVPDKHIFMANVNVI